MNIIHVISDSQKIQYFLLPEDLKDWLDKLGRTPFPEEYSRQLFEQEDMTSIKYEEYSKFLNKEIKNSLLSNDFAMLPVIYNSLKFPSFNSIIELFDFINSNGVEISMERYDVSEGL